ncbi:MAG TPA: GNAT family protein [Saprospiraceae bacterium]|nr:GNAT family protein [Saprospiraceae bacterium]HMU04119.1 GNAT family protein [Saprospiraceae bacterium]
MSLTLELKIIQPDEDKSNELYTSDNGQELMHMMDAFYLEVGFNVPWVGYVILNNNQVVGTAAFTGKPVDNTVEISYWTFKEWEGQGIASFACKELISIAKNTSPSVIITAKTLPKHNASTKILQNNNFKFVKIVQDHEIGDAWLWVRDH